MLAFYKSRGFLALKPIPQRMRSTLFDSHPNSLTQAKRN